MKITEFTNPLPLFQVTVRAKTASATSNLRTAIYAEGPSQAQQLLRASYGEDSVVCVCMSEGTQTLTPDQLKLKSLADQKVEVGQRQKEERARQTFAKAQKKMQIVNRARAASTGFRCDPAGHCTQLVNANGMCNSIANAGPRTKPPPVP